MLDIDIYTVYTVHVPLNQFWDAKAASRFSMARLSNKNMVISLGHLFGEPLFLDPQRADDFDQGWIPGYNQ